MRAAQRFLFENMWYLNIILKARQLGFSTAIQIFLLDYALFNDNKKCGVIAQDLQAAGEIFRTKIKFPFENMPAWLRAELAVTSEQGKVLMFKNGSSISVATSFRSGTCQALHISEHGKICAKYPLKAAEVKSGSLNSVHDGSMIFIESTAEGIGGDFFDFTMTAKEKHDEGTELGKQDFKFFFFPWWQDPKYSSPVIKGTKLTREETQYFKSVEKSCGITLTPEQKQWYITKARVQGTMMKQEYPSTPMEAFLTSGRKAFKPEYLELAETNVITPAYRAEVNPTTNKMTFDNTGRLFVFEEPDPEKSYALGADVAEGIEVIEGKGGDYSSLDVVDEHGEQVAHWRGHLDTDLFAELIAFVGKMYAGRNSRLEEVGKDITKKPNTYVVRREGLYYEEKGGAFVGVERNNHGHAVLQKLVTIYPRGRIFQEVKIDEKTKKRTEKVGWHTNAHSKPFLIDNMVEYLREDTHGLRHKATIDEMHTYVIDEKGRYNAQSGCYDDRVMSYMIAKEMAVRMPRPTRTLKSRPVKDDWRAA